MFFITWMMWGYPCLVCMIFIWIWIYLIIIPWYICSLFPFVILAFEFIFLFKCRTFTLDMSPFSIFKTCNFPCWCFFLNDLLFPFFSQEICKLFDNIIIVINGLLLLIAIIKFYSCLWDNIFWIFYFYFMLLQSFKFHFMLLKFSEQGSRRHGRKTLLFWYHRHLWLSFPGLRPKHFKI